MKKSCVIGWPISHSRSPLIHNYWLRTYNLKGHYGIVPVRPEDLPGFVRSLADRGYAGCNVTIPHKEAVFALVENRDAKAARLGAVNTLYTVDGTLHATNTDGEGFIASLKTTVPNVQIANQRVAILGAGGSAMAIVGALTDEAAGEIAVFNRSIERSEALRRRFGHHLKSRQWSERNTGLNECTLLINTTSLGMTGQPPLDIDLATLPASATVADIIYAPLVTPLLQQARDRGHSAVSGLGMLLHQAVRGFELWFGTRPVVTEELYDIVARDIDPGYTR
jgi:shikimate dehydrogenase